MPTNTSTTTQANGVSNEAQGVAVTTSAAAAAKTFTVGFIPRIIRFHNVTDRISDEWYSGMDEGAIYSALLGINAKLDSDAGVTPTDFAATCNPASASLTDLATSINALTAKLDASAGVTDTNFAALWPAGTTAATMKAAINGINAKLDADAGVTDTDFAATWNVVACSLHTAANGVRTFNVAIGVLNNLDGTFTMDATAMAASKVFVWECIG